MTLPVLSSIKKATCMDSAATLTHRSVSYTHLTLKKGSARLKFLLRPLPDEEKPELLKTYLDTFRKEVQTYFPVAAGSPPEAFVELAGSYPVFELVAA